MPAITSRWIHRTAGNYCKCGRERASWITSRLNQIAHTNVAECIWRTGDSSGARKHLSGENTHRPSMTSDSEPPLSDSPRPSKQALGQRSSHAHTLPLKPSFSRRLRSPAKRKWPRAHLNFNPIALPPGIAHTHNPKTLFSLCRSA